MMFFVTPRWFGWDGFRGLTTILILQVTVVASADALVATYIQTFPGILAWQLFKDIQMHKPRRVKLCSSFWPVFLEILSLSCPNPEPAWGPSTWNQGQKNTPSDRMLCNIKIRRTVSNWTALSQLHLWTSTSLLVPHGLNLPIRPIRKELTKSGSLVLYGCRLKRHADSSVQTWFTDLRFMGHRSTEQRLLHAMELPSGYVKIAMENHHF